MRFLLLFLLISLISACSAPYLSNRFPEPIRPPQTTNQTSRPVDAPSLQPTQPPKIEFTRTTPTPDGVSVVDSGTISTEPPPLPTTPLLTINVESMPLPTFINEIFGNLLRLPFEITPELQTKQDLVTLRIGENRPPLEIYKLVKQVLENYGVGIQRQGELLRFVLLTTATSTEIPLLISGRTLPSVPISHRTVFQIVPVKVGRFNNISYWVRTLFANQGVSFTDDSNFNSIMLTGPEAKVRQAIQVIELFDQPLLRGRYSVRIKPAFLNSDVMARSLIEVLKSQGYDVGTGIPANTIIFSIPQINSVIVFAPDEQILNHVQRWAADLDQPPPPQEGKNFYFYPVQNTMAENLANLVSNLIGDAEGSSTSGNTTTLPISTPATAGNSPSATTTTNTTNSSPSGLNLGTQGKLVVDEINNALLFYGSGQVWARLLPILKQMDQIAKMVMIEVTVAEITLTDQEQFGIEWLIRGLGLNDLNGTLRLSGLGAGQTGLTYVFDNAGQTRLLLNAFASNSQVTIMSTPRLMVKSGEEASINVGTDVPIITSQTASPEQSGGTTGVLQQIQYRRTGILLGIKPIVHAGNRIDLSIRQEVSSVAGATSSGVNSPSIFTRSIDTKLSLQDGSSILMGGLISDSKSMGMSGIPILSRIPLVGSLFRTDTQESTRTELVVLIVPYVIRDNNEAVDITNAFRNLLQIESTNPDVGSFKVPLQ